MGGIHPYTVLISELKLMFLYCTLLYILNLQNMRLCIYDFLRWRCCLKFLNMVAFLDL